MFSLRPWQGLPPRQDILYRFVSLPRRADDEAPVAFQRGQPVLDICGTVGEGLRGFKPCVVNQRRAADFSTQFFLRVFFAAEVRRGVQPCKALHVPCTVHHFMESGAVVFGGFGELLQEGKHNVVCGGLVDGAVTFAVFDGYSFALGVFGDNRFGGFVGACGGLGWSAYALR